MKKYLILLFSTFILLVLGATYTYSVFLESFTGAFGISKSVASIPFSIFLFCYAMGMGVAGKLYSKYSPRILTFLGGGCFALGFILSSFTQNIFQLSITYGLLSGFGLAFAYVTPITLVSQWFVDKKGLTSGIVISAFGLGSFFLSPLSNNLLNKIGWRNTLRYEGIIFLLIIVLSSLILERPKEENNKVLNKENKITVTYLFKNKTFIRIWVSYVVALTTGLMIMGHIIPIAKEIGFNPSKGAVLISIIAIFNALGRITIGVLGDRFSGTKMLSILYFLQGVVFVLFLLAYKLPILLYISVILFGFNFGGWLVLYPIVSSEYFGIESLSAVYGILFSSYGIAGLLGPICISFLQSIFGSYIIPFQISSALCIFAFIILLPLKNKGLYS
ncbi:OFA family MFS transporter [Clostridium sediminicola]|uniref:OFA family MFS transporter n=1 Tax=Clostridium sediminicola TaxID=3114879 RepID=UPI0031F24A15